jgi:hypothetical protein
MSDVVEGLMRLAWHAESDGKPGTRDALLTLVVVESLAEDAVLAERCRRLLVARQPGHWFAAAPTVSQALARDRVASALAKLKSMFPPVRVRHLLLREEARRGPYTGRSPSLTSLMDDLIPLPEGRRIAMPHALPFPAGRSAQYSETDPDGKLAAFYFSVLLAMAVLLQGVLEQSSTDSRAA